METVTATAIFLNPELAEALCKATTGPDGASVSAPAEALQALGKRLKAIAAAKPAVKPKGRPHGTKNWDMPSVLYYVARGKGVTQQDALRLVREQCPSLTGDDETVLRMIRRYKMDAIDFLEKYCSAVLSPLTLMDLRHGLRRSRKRT